MKKSLAHLPQLKADEVELIAAKIRALAEDVQMVILFGSYARGEAVEDIHTEAHTTHVYKSDFDILENGQLFGDPGFRFEDFIRRSNLDRLVKG